MKKFIIFFAIMMATVTVSKNVQAQHINVNINIGTQPAWGPVGYDYVDYYYMPDINVYYIVNTHNYVYLDGGRWITARYLPYRYRNYDLYGMYKVVLVDGVRDPWRYNSRHYSEYGRYRNYRGQSVIRDSRDTRYSRSRNNSAPWYRESSPNRVTNSRTSSRPTSTTRPNTTNATSRPSSNNSSNSTRPSSSSRNDSNVRSTSREASSGSTGTGRASSRSNTSNTRTSSGSSRR